MKPHILEKAYWVAGIVTALFVVYGAMDCTGHINTTFTPVATGSGVHTVISTTQLRESASATSRRIDWLETGEVVSVLSSDLPGGYYHVESESGKRGYVKIEDVQQ